MAGIERINLQHDMVDIHRDLTIGARARRPGPPERIDGMTLGVVTIEPGQSPHKGEMHPDGDEILFVVSGTLVVSSDSTDQPMILQTGQACIVRRGEWHMVDCTETTVLLHVTPGPNGEARFD